MDAKKLRNNIYWVGVKDPNLEIFDVIMETEHGTTYNSYLIDDEKVAIIDTVKNGFYDEYLSNIKQVIGDRKVDYIIVQHTELDHSGSLIKLIEDYPEAEIICSNAAANYLKDILNKEANIKVAPEQLSLGDTTLKFIIAPNLHWPDTMFTYVEKEKVLFTCDFLGCHNSPKGDIMTGENEDLDEDVIYYYNVIMGPFKKFVLNGLEKIKDLDFDLVGTSHGPIHTKNNIDKYMKMYKDMASDESYVNNKIQILYVSAYGNTEKVAKYFCDKLNEKNIKAEVHDVSCENLEEVAKKIEGSKGIIVGSPTINQDAVKPVWDALSLVSAIINRGKPAAAFGSYGWSGEAVPMMTERLKSLKFKTLDEGFRFKFVPSDDDFKKADEFLDKYIELL